MVAIKQYPHSISVILATIPGQDGAGNIFIPEGAELNFRCRAEKKQADPAITIVDGKQLFFECDVYLPKTNEVIPYDSKAIITVGNGLFYEGLVKFHVNNQLNSKMLVECSYSGLAG